MRRAAAELLQATQALIPLTHRHRIDATSIHKLSRALTGVVGFITVTNYAGTTLPTAIADLIADVQAIADDLAIRKPQSGRRTVTATAERIKVRREWIVEVLNKHFAKSLRSPRSTSEAHRWLEEDGTHPIARSTLDDDLRALAKEKNLRKKLPPMSP